MWDLLAAFELQGSASDSFLHSFQGTKPCKKVFLETPPKKLVLLIQIKRENPRRKGGNPESNCHCGFLFCCWLEFSYWKVGKRSLKLNCLGLFGLFWVGFVGLVFFLPRSKHFLLQRINVFPGLWGEKIQRQSSFTLRGCILSQLKEVDKAPWFAWRG